MNIEVSAQDLIDALMQQRDALAQDVAMKQAIILMQDRRIKELEKGGASVTVGAVTPPPLDNPSIG